MTIAAVSVAMVRGISPAFSDQQVPKATPFELESDATRQRRNGIDRDVISADGLSAKAFTADTFRMAPKTTCPRVDQRMYRPFDGGVGGP